MTSKAISGCIIFILSLAFYSSGEAANWNPLPDTGQTKCYDADGNEITCPAEGEPFYGQDANYPGASTSYTDNGDGTVTDNNTGLIWQQNTADTNLDGAITSDDKKTWEGADTYCSKGLDTGGRTWRLPEVMELESIVDYSGTAVISSPFTCVSGAYWSSDAPDDDDGSSVIAWYVSFPSGHSYWPSKATYNYVRCVAGP